MFLGCSCMCSCICPCISKVVNTILKSIGQWTYFHQTFSIGAFWYKDECFIFWVPKVKVTDNQGLSGWRNAESVLCIMFNF